MSNISSLTQLKTACVTKKGNRYYYPKTIPREREPITFTYIVLKLVVIIRISYVLGDASLCIPYPQKFKINITTLCFLLFLVHLCLTEDRSSIISVYAFTICFYFFIILVHRIVLLIREKPHSLSRYGDDYIKMLKSAFYFKGPSILVFVMCILYIVFYLERYGWPKFKMEFCFVIVFLFILHRILELDSNPINDSLNIAKGNGLDYGSGMAYSFFYGYLNYILPKTGDQEKNLKELMQDYEAVNDIKFEVYKIFILIPKSLECPVSIEEASNGLIEMRESLLEKTITVAGVKNRVYKNSVYSIIHEKTNRKVYVCTEYATPIKTFKEVVKNVTPHTEFYKRHKNHILLQFYVTLRQILEHTHMDKMCELVFYEDMDEANKYHDVGRILLDRIVEIKKRDQDPKEK